MKKRIISLILAAAMTASLAGCRGTEQAATEAADTTAAAATEEASQAEGETEAAEEGTETAGNFKIGIITGTASQGDEEITQANKMKEKYGDMIVTATYPDNFTTETETVISNAVAMASDPDVKAIVWCQAIPGTAAAIDRVREDRKSVV